MDIGLYLHFPFCIKKCHYCDFTSYTDNKHMLDAYISSNVEEIMNYSRQLEGIKVKTIFFGGGTPSIMEASDIEIIMNTIYKSFNILDDIEITIEANPGTLNYNKLKSYRSLGINRLSVGLQACDDVLLKTLGRIHSYQDFVVNYHEAKRAGFENINVDLMMGLPGQHMLGWRKALEEITALDIPHISVYSLIWEEETPFYHMLQEGTIQQLEEDTELEILHYTRSYLKSKGYQQYEISNFCKPGYQCNHNKIYWNNQSYIGIGAGAHSYHMGRRYYNYEEIEVYINKINNNESPIKSSIQVTRSDEISETMFLGLRMIDGIEINRFVSRFAVHPNDIYGEKLKALQKDKLLIVDDERIRLTEKGLDLGNIVFREMLIED